MKNYFTSPDRKDSILLSLMYIVLGLALCFFSGSLLTGIVRVIGIVLALYGAWQLYVYFGVRKSASTAPMVIGIPALICGLILTAWPHLLISFFPVVAGLLLIFSSIVQIQKSLMLKNAGYNDWMLTLVIALAMLALGVVLIVRPMGIVNTILRVTGIALAVEGGIILFETLTHTRKLG